MFTVRRLALPDHIRLAIHGRQPLPAFPRMLARTLRKVNALGSYLLLNALRTTYSRGPNLQQWGDGMCLRH